MVKITRERLKESFKTTVGLCQNHAHKVWKAVKHIFQNLNELFNNTSFTLSPNALGPLKCFAGVGVAASLYLIPRDINEVFIAKTDCIEYSVLKLSNNIFNLMQSVACTLEGAVALNWVSCINPAIKVFYSISAVFSITALCFEIFHAIKACNVTTDKQGIKALSENKFYIYTGIKKEFINKIFNYRHGDYETKMSAVLKHHLKVKTMSHAIGALAAFINIIAISILIALPVLGHGIIVGAIALTCISVTANFINNYLTKKKLNKIIVSLSHPHNSIELAGRKPEALPLPNN